MRVRERRGQRRVVDRLGQIARETFDIGATTPEYLDHLRCIEQDEQQMLERLGLGAITDLIVPEGPEGVRDLLALAYHEPPKVPGFVLRDVHKNLFTDWTAEKVALLDDLHDNRSALVGSYPDPVWLTGPPPSRSSPPSGCMKPWVTPCRVPAPVWASAARCIPTTVPPRRTASRHPCPGGS